MFHHSTFFSPSPDMYVLHLYGWRYHHLSFDQMMFSFRKIISGDGHTRVCFKESSAYQKTNRPCIFSSAIDKTLSIVVFQLYQISFQVMWLPSFHVSRLSLFVFPVGCSLMAELFSLKSILLKHHFLVCVFCSCRRIYIFADKCGACVIRSPLGFNPLG